MGINFVLWLSDATRTLDTCVSLICGISALATAVWVMMHLPLLVQRNSLSLFFLMLFYVVRNSR